MQLLDQAGWTLEMDKACTFQQAPAGITLLQDGVQVWRNEHTADPLVGDEGA